MSPAIYTVSVAAEPGAKAKDLPRFTPEYHEAKLEPGQGFETSDGRVYVAHQDGSLRRAGRERTSKKERRARRRRQRRDEALARLDRALADAADFGMGYTAAEEEAVLLSEQIAEALPALQKLAPERDAAWTEEDWRRTRESHEYVVARGLRPDPEGGA